MRARSTGLKQQRVQSLVCSLWCCILRYPCDIGCSGPLAQAISECTPDESQMQAMMPTAARFLSLDELDPSTQFCADPEVCPPILGGLLLVERIHLLWLWLVHTCWPYLLTSLGMCSRSWSGYQDCIRDLDYFKANAIWHQAAHDMIGDNGPRG